MIWFICFAILILFAVPWRINIVHHTLKSRKIHRDLNICVLADLHCRRFGKKQSRITRIVEQIHPDCIVIPGDLFDYERDYEICFELIEQLKKYPVFYVWGNHERFIEKDMPVLIKRLKDAGVHVLENQSEVLLDIEWIGLMDLGRKPEMKKEQFDSIAETDKYRIVLSHRPHYIDFYNQIPCDLILSGHAHGGQWCIPFTKIGLYAPQQGIFPKYTHGVYTLKGKKMFVSRGLASGTPKIPRLFNNPEIGWITIQKEGNL
ncbi:MAG: metallophosphoesterase [Solobacterium sp.]|nr:metallophosphoesterase [Solobacterium sp.]